MSKYTVYLNWMYSGEHIIEAKNEDEAKEKALKMNLPDGEFLKGSLRAEEIIIEDE